MCGLGRARRPEAFSFFCPLKLVFTSRPVSSMGRDGSGEGGDMKAGVGGGDDCAARAALLVSSMAADTCSASCAPPTHASTLGVIRPLCVQFPVSAGTRGSPMMFML